MSKLRSTFRKRAFYGLLVLVAVLVLVVNLPRSSFTQTNEGARRAPLNPAFVDFLNTRARGLAVPMTAEGRGLGLIPSPHRIPPAATLPARLLTLGTIPTSYDLRSQSKLTPIKNQGNCGSCWAFATYGSLESYLMPGEESDFSENDLIQKHGWDYDPCYGGMIDMSMAYLGRWQGPIDEADNPYPYSYAASGESTESSSAAKKHVQQAVYFPMRVGTSNDDILKTAVMNYGAIYVTMKWCDDAYNATDHSYYDDGTYYSRGGHAICIVGWDDNYSASNFNKTAPANGAFLVRNSWGTSWGDSGYFYVSYYDGTFGRQDYSAAFTGEPTNNYKSVYQYDTLGWVSSWGYYTDTAWGANIFTAKDKTPITAVSFYAETAGASYEIYVYTGVTAGKPRTGTLQCSTSGSLTYAGYYTIGLPASVPLTSGQKFSVVVKFTTPGYGYPVPSEDRINGYSSAATSSPGQSFLDSSGAVGTPWEDLSANSYKTNVCIKAFSGGSAPPATISVTAPASGDSWYKGANQTITWSTDGLSSANVMIQLMRGSNVIKTVANPTANDGSFTWKVPGTITAGSSYFIRVKTKDGAAQGDSALFSILAPYLTVGAPASGAVWYRGETQMITWTATGTTAPNVKIQLFHGAKRALTIAPSAPNSGDYSWPVPKSLAPRTDYYVKIRTSDGLAVGSSALFSIKAPTTSP